MLRWSIEVLEDGKSAAIFDIPGTIDKAEIIELLKRIAAKGLTPREIVGCVWSEHYGKLQHLDVQHWDEGRTLYCGDSLISATARQMVRTPKA